MLKISNYFTHFYLATKVTKSQGEKQWSNARRPKLTQGESRAKLAWAMPRQSQLGDSQFTDLQVG